MLKKEYDALKDIQRRVNAGLPTSFSERNFLNMHLKREKKKKNRIEKTNSQPKKQ